MEIKLGALEEAAQEILKDVMEKAARNLVGEHFRFGRNERLEEAVVSRAKELLLNDAEINQKLREALLSWLEKERKK